MSSFTRFSAVESLQYDPVASKKYGKDHWRVTEGYRYYIGHKGSDRYVDIPTGFVTDGATIPRMLWWLLPPLGEYSQATTLHDYLCKHHEIIHLVDGVPTAKFINRAEVDRILAEAMDVLKVATWKKRLINSGVWLYRNTVYSLTKALAT